MNAAAALTICEFISFWISPLACMLLPKNVSEGIFVFLVPSHAVFELGVTKALIRFPFCNCSLTLFFFFSAEQSFDVGGFPVYNGYIVSLVRYG